MAAAWFSTRLSAATQPCARHCYTLAIWGGLQLATAVVGAAGCGTHYSHKAAKNSAFCWSSWGLRRASVCVCAARQQQIYSPSLPTILVPKAWKTVGLYLQKALKLAAPPSMRAMQERLDEVVNEFDANPADCLADVADDLRWLSAARAEKLHLKSRYGGPTKASCLWMAVEQWRCARTPVCVQGFLYNIIVTRPVLSLERYCCYCFCCCSFVLHYGVLPSRQERGGTHTSHALVLEASGCRVSLFNVFFLVFCVFLYRGAVWTTTPSQSTFPTRHSCPAVPCQRPSRRPSVPPVAPRRQAARAVTAQLAAAAAAQ